MPSRTNTMITLMFGCFLMMAGCGQKGALYHPEDSTAKTPSTPAQQEKPCQEKDCKQP